MIEKEINGFERYKVTSEGDIIGLYKQKMKPDIGSFGYCRVQIWNNGIVKRKLVHRIVAEAFIPNPENKATVNHINGIKNDNRVCNLEWATQSENSKHAHRTGLNKISIAGKEKVREISRIKASKIVLNLETGIFFASAKEAAFSHGIKYSTLASWVNGYRSNKSPFIHV